MNNANTCHVTSSVATLYGMCVTVSVSFFSQDSRLKTNKKKKTLPKFILQNYEKQMNSHTMGYRRFDSGNGRV